MRGLLQRDLKVVAQVGTAAGGAAIAVPAKKLVEDPAPAATLLAEDFAENVERVVKTAAAARSRSLLEGSMTVAIVGRAFFLNISSASLLPGFLSG